MRESVEIHVLADLALKQIEKFLEDISEGIDRSPSTEDQRIRKYFF